MAGQDIYICGMRNAPQWMAGRACDGQHCVGAQDLITFDEIKDPVHMFIRNDNGAVVQRCYSHSNLFAWLARNRTLPEDRRRLSAEQLEHLGIGVPYYNPRHRRVRPVEWGSTMRHLVARLRMIQSGVTEYLLMLADPSFPEEERPAMLEHIRVARREIDEIYTLMDERDAA